MNYLSKQGYTLSEIYYLASLAKASGKTVTSVAALHSQGVGWGILAQRLGVRPDALRKLIVEQKKADKMMIREQKRQMVPARSPMMEKREGMGRGMQQRQSMPGGMRGKSKGR